MGRLFEELKRRNVLRVAAAYLAGAWLIVQLMEALLPMFGLEETSGRPVVIFLVLGFVPALILAWFFQFTPEGLRTQTDLDREGDDSAPSQRALDVTIIVFLVLAVGYFSIDKFLIDPGRDRAAVQTAVEDALSAPIDRSIAVLPFIDLSPAQDQEYFSDGLSEELLNLLAKIPDLRVAARTSSFAFKNKDVQITDVAEALRVGHVLEGSVRMSGDRVRITAQLIKADDGYHVWSDTFERTLDDIFEVQDDIAAEVVSALEMTLVDPVPKTRRTSGEAYDLFLEAQYFQQQYTPEGMQRAVELLNQVIDIDPDYVPAQVRLSSAYMNLATSEIMPHEEAAELANEALQTAIRIDPEFAGAYAQLGWIAHVFEGNLSSAALYYERALELAPTNEGVIGNAAVLAEALGRLDQSIAMKRYLAERASTSAIAFNNLALAYFYDRQFDEAEDAIRKTVLLSPDYIGAHYRLGKVLLYKEEFEAALAEFEKEPDDEYRLKGRALALYSLGRQPEADEALAQLVADWGEQYPTEMAQAYAYRNELDEAFAWLARREEQGGPGSWGEQKLDLLYENLHDDPRWSAFLQRMGVSDEQLGRISFTATLPAPSD